MPEPTENVIVGDVEAGRAVQVRRQINKLIYATNTNTFDLAELLHEVKSKNFFTAWSFESFSKYAKSLDIKYSKSYYLVRIVENMRAAGLAREAYEPVGLGKLRVISRLKPETEFKGTPVSLLINQLTLKAIGMSLEEVQHEVDTILGLTEDESMVWLNIHIKKLSRENVVKPALALAKKHIGSVAKDEDGNSVDASDGAALEMICANFLADPNYNQEDVVPESVPDSTGGVEADEVSIEEVLNAAPTDEDQ